MTSPPYITDNVGSLVERYKNLDHDSHNRDIWWDKVMYAIFCRGKKGVPGETVGIPDDGAISVLIVNQLMRKKLKATFLKRFNQEVLFEFPYPVGFSKEGAKLAHSKLIDSAHEVIICYRRAIRAPAQIEYPIPNPAKHMADQEPDGKRAYLSPAENGEMVDDYEADETTPEMDYEANPRVSTPPPASLPKTSQNEALISSIAGTSYLFFDATKPNENSESTMQTKRLLK